MKQLHRTFFLLISFIFVSMFSIFNVHAQDLENDKIPVLKSLEKLVLAPQVEVKYKNDRFEAIYEKSEQAFKNKDYETAISHGLDYFNRTFSDTCKSLSIVTKSYEALEDEKNFEIYTAVEKFCESMLESKDLESMKAAHEGIKKLLSTYKDEEILVVMDIAFRVTMGEKGIQFPKL